MKTLYIQQSAIAKGCQQYFAADQYENYRYSIHGVRVEVANKKATFIATDGRRISIAEFDVIVGTADDAFSFTIPLKEAKKIARIKDAKATASIVYCDKLNHAKFIYGDVKAKLKSIEFDTLDLRYPNWRQAIAVGCESASIKGKAEYIATFFEPNDSIDLSLNGKVEVRQPVQEMRVKYEGKVDVRFNRTYLFEWLEYAHELDCTIRFQGNDSTIICDAGNYRYALMPMNK